MSRHFEAQCPQKTLVMAGGQSQLGFQVGNVGFLDAIVDDDSGSIDLFSLSVMDTSAQVAPLAVLFFNDVVTPLNGDNAQFDLSAADAAKYIGMAQVAASGFVQGGSKSYGCNPNIRLPLRVKTATGGIPKRRLYFVVVSGGNGLYTANCLTFTFGVMKA